MTNRKIVQVLQRKNAKNDVLIAGKGKNPTLYFVKKSKANLSIKKEKDIKQYSFKCSLQHLKQLEDELHQLRVRVKKALGVIVDTDLVKYHDDGTFTCSYSQLNY